MINKSIPVFLSSDDNYVPYMSALMVSIMENTQADVDFYIIDAGITEYHRRQISLMALKYGFGLEFIKSEPYRHLFNVSVKCSGHITRASSDRFLIPFMKPNLDKVIVLDTDMIALGDIQKLWDINLDDKVLASAQVFCWTDIKLADYILKKVNITLSHKYFNIGTIIIDCKKWRDEKILEKVKDVTKNYDLSNIGCWDELALNAVLKDNNYKILDPKFNMMVPLQIYYKSGKPEDHKKVVEDYLGLSPDFVFDEIIFSHFALPQVKPWNTRMYFYEPTNRWVEIPNFNEFWHYLKLTPFYEGEMLAFLNKNSISQETIKKIVIDSITFSLLKRKYLKFKILSKITFGNLRKKYKQKRKDIKIRLRCVRDFMNI